MELVVALVWAFGERGVSWHWGYEEGDEEGRISMRRGDLRPSLAHVGSLDMGVSERGDEEDEEKE